MAARINCNTCCNKWGCIAWLFPNDITIFNNEFKCFFLHDRLGHLIGYDFYTPDEYKSPEDYNDSQLADQRIKYKDRAEKCEFCPAYLGGDPSDPESCSAEQDCCWLRMSMFEFKW